MKRPRVALTVALAVIGISAATSLAVAQRFGRNSACSTNWDAQGYFVSPFFRGNPLYDGRVTFARDGAGFTATVQARGPKGGARTLTGPTCAALQTTATRPPASLAIAMARTKKMRA